MNAVRTVRWTSWDGEGHEEATYGPPAGADAGVLIAGQVRAGPTGDPWLTYRVLLDDGWRTRDVDVRLADGRRLHLRSDGEGTWTRDGRAEPALDGALDIDLSATPATNTLPIRRLGLAVGAAADIDVAYVDVPALAMRLDRQRYTRLSERAYRFEQPATGFMRDVEVDDDGIVARYPGLFRRIA